jgi:steroid delta-isomerase-like uncharacterized protein
MRIIAFITLGCCVFIPLTIRCENSKFITKIITPSSNPTKSSAYDNTIELVKDFYVSFQEVDNEKLGSFLSEDYRVTNLGSIQDSSYTKFTTMSKNLKIRAAALKKAFPDYSFQFGQFVADGNKVVAFVTLSGTQKGPFLGVAPTNKPIHIKFVDVFTIENGKILEFSQMWNELSVMKQIGYIIF